MNIHADKTQENKSQSVFATDPQKQSGDESSFQFIDNRSEAVAQRKFQEVAKNSQQVSQLRAFQDVANNIPQAKKVAQMQAMANKHSAQQNQPLQKKNNNTGLPDNLKTGMENLSGMSLDDVRVHRNSDKPAAVQAHAFAQGRDIHLGPGQEKHLPHEAWHVVQQAQELVKPTMHAKRMAINDDPGLEAEADRMGVKAIQLQAEMASAFREPNSLLSTSANASALVYGLAALQRSADQSAASEKVRKPAIGVGVVNTTPALATIARLAPLQLAKGKVSNNTSYGPHTLRRGDLIEYEELNRLKYKIKNLTEKTEFIMETGGATFVATLEPIEDTSTGPMTLGELSVNDKVVFKNNPQTGFWILKEITQKSGSKPSMGKLQDPSGELSDKLVLLSAVKAFSAEDTAFSAEKNVGGLLVMDEDVENKFDAIANNTPSVVKSRGKPLEGKEVSDVKASKIDFSKTANIDVAHSVTDVGIEFVVTLTSNPEYMSKTKRGEIRDLCPVMLERANDSFIDTVAVLEPVMNLNQATFEAKYTWSCLHQLLFSKPQTKAADALAAVTKAYPTLGVKAQWLAANTSGKNSPNHTMGGVLQKGGSGLIRLRTITLEDYLATENIRNTDWNAGEILHKKRPVYVGFSNLLQLGKELATTLEAESEYLIHDPEQLMAVVDKMQKLALSKDLQEKCGVLKMEDKGVKIYHDTYYDLKNMKDEKDDLALLKRGVVLRRRSVEGDEVGTFLFTVKGRQVALADDEIIRLAAQTQMKETALKELPAFLRDKSADNAFARAFQDALNPDEISALDISEEQQAGMTIEPVLQIQSKRYKFLMMLADSTAIDFSADIATGSVVGSESETKEICSIEFGVGHPGLSATAAVTGGSLKGDKEGLVHRPYHVPSDLDNKDLFEKSDYMQYQNLRDVVMSQVLSLNKAEMKKGGNKAQILAKRLDLIDK